MRGTNIMLYRKQLDDQAKTELQVQADRDNVEVINTLYDVSQPEPRRFWDCYIFDCPPYAFMQWSTQKREDGHYQAEDWEPEPDQNTAYDTPIKLSPIWKSAFEELKNDVPEISKSLDLCIRRLENPNEFV